MLKNTTHFYRARRPSSERRKCTVFTELLYSYMHYITDVYLMRAIQKISTKNNFSLVNDIRFENVTLCQTSDNHGRHMLFTL